jgi:hypothetical protein
LADRLTVYLPFRPDLHPRLWPRLIDAFHNAR